MIKEILVPKLGMSQGQVTVVQWLKAPGDTARAEETVVVIETAKVSYEIPAPADGLVFPLVPEKSKADIGGVLGVMADSREAYGQYAPGAASTEPGAESDGGLFDGLAEPSGLGLQLVIGHGGQPQGPGQTTAAPNWLTPPPQTRIDLTDRPIRERLPLVGMRRTIADNLMYSLHSSAQLTVFAQADLTELEKFRQELKLDRPEAKITFVDMLVKLLPVALAEHPLLNSAVVDDEIICWDEYHIGVAVALENGLVVPVVRNADRKSLVAVSREIKKLAGKARSGELAPEDYQGGTFTISSGGPVEVEFVTPIINPPENAILGLGKIGPKPAVVDGQLAVRTMTYLCLTHDHRVVDGVPAAGFLGRLKALIETPELFRKVLR
jgi:pyruvate/2-oxoglutarate dehydrogenase complex dihydrolipoamide acyltransferase (E2) component